MCVFRKATRVRDVSGWSPFYPGRYHLLLEDRPEATRPNMVDGPLYQQEQVQRPINQVGKAGRAREVTRKWDEYLMMHGRAEPRRACNHMAEPRRTATRPVLGRPHNSPPSIVKPHPAGLWIMAEVIHRPNFGIDRPVCQAGAARLRGLAGRPARLGEQSSASGHGATRNLPSIRTVTCSYVNRARYLELRTVWRARLAVQRVFHGALACDGPAIRPGRFECCVAQT
jgi:hypothetical protein